MSASYRRDMKHRDPAPSQGSPSQTVIASLRDGLLCGAYPRNLYIQHPAGRTVYNCAWRGDRATLLDMARMLAALPPGHALFAGVVEFVWDHPRDPDRRRRRESTRDLGALAHVLLAEEAEREGRRSPRRGRVKWRAGSRLSGAVGTEHGQ